MFEVSLIKHLNEKSVLGSPSANVICFWWHLNQNSSIQNVFNLIILKQVKGERIEEALTSVNVIKLCPLKPFLLVMSFQFSIPRRLFSEGHLEFMDIVRKENNNSFCSFIWPLVSRHFPSRVYCVLFTVVNQQKPSELIQSSAYTTWCPPLKPKELIWMPAEQVTLNLLPL